MMCVMLFVAMVSVAAILIMVFMMFFVSFMGLMFFFMLNVSIKMPLIFTIADLVRKMPFPEFNDIRHCVGWILNSNGVFLQRWMGNNVHETIESDSWIRNQLICIIGDSEWFVDLSNMSDYKLLCVGWNLMIIVCS